MSTESDRDLLTTYAQSGDPRAFDALVTRYRAMAYRVCLRILADPHEAEDATQAVFVVLMKKAAGLRKNGVLASWLHAVARQTALCMVRGRMRRSRREAAGGEMLAADNAEELDEATQQALLTVLDRELAALSDRQRQAVILRYLEGHSAEDAAAIAGCETDALRARASDGIARLRSRLARRSVALSVPVLAAALGAEAQAAIPQTVLSSITGASTFAAANAAAGAAGAAGGGTIMSLANATMKAMFVAKVKAVAAVCAAAVVVGVGLPAAVTLATTPLATPAINASAEIEIKADGAAARLLDAAKYAGFAAVAEVKALPQAGDATKPAQLGIEWKDLLYAPDAIRQAMSVVNALTLADATAAAELKVGDRILVAGDRVTRYVLPGGSAIKFEGQSPEVLPKNGNALLEDAQCLPWSQERQNALQAALAPGWNGANCPWCALFLNDDRRPPMSQRACQACNKPTNLPSNEKFCPTCAAQRGECWTCNRTVGPATRDVLFRLWAYDPNGERDLTPRNECRIKAGANSLPLWVEVQNEKGETPEFQTPGGGKRFDCCKTLFYMVEGPGLAGPKPAFHFDGGALARMAAPFALQKGSATGQVQLLVGKFFATPGTYTVRAVAGRLVSSPLKVIVEANGTSAGTDAERRAKQQEQATERQAQIEREQELKERAAKERGP